MNVHFKLAKSIAEDDIKSIIHILGESIDLNCRFSKYKLSNSGDELF